MAGLLQGMWRAVVDLTGLASPSVDSSEQVQANHNPDKFSRLVRGEEDPHMALRRKQAAYVAHWNALRAVIGCRQLSIANQIRKDNEGDDFEEGQDGELERLERDLSSFGVRLQEREQEVDALEQAILFEEESLQLLKKNERYVSSDLVVPKCLELELKGKKGGHVIREAMLECALEGCLSAEQEDEADKIMGQKTIDTCPKLLTVAGHELVPVDLQSLRYGQWLSSPVINAYLELIKHVSAEFGLGCSFLSSYFFTSLLTARGYQYNRVRRWTKRQKINIYDGSVRLLLIPVHVHGNHWTVIVADFDNLTISFYDSLGGRHQKTVDGLIRWITDEIDDKMPDSQQYPSFLTAAQWRQSGLQKFDASKFFKVRFPQDIPRQQNGYDCGVFMLSYISYLVHDVPFSFSGRDMHTLRRKIALELAQNALFTLPFLTSK